MSNNNNFSSLESINLFFGNHINSNNDALPLNHIGKLVNDLTNLLNESDYYDVEIKVGKDNNVKIFKAHSNILKARSSYFKAALSNNWLSKSENGIIIFEKQTISPKIFEVLLAYIYNGIVNINNLDPDEILGLLEICDELCFGELIDYLQNYLIVEKQKWIKQNLIYVYRFSLQYQLSFSMLQNNCNELICENPGLVFFNSENDGYKVIEKSTMSFILESDYLKIENEIDIWDHIIQWGVKQIESFEEAEEEKKRKKAIELGQYSSKNKKPKLIKLEENISEWDKDNIIQLKSHLKDLIPLIRFNMIPSHDFNEKIQPYKEAIDKEVYKELIRYYYHADEWQPRLLIQKGPRIGKLLNLEMRHLISSWVDEEQNTSTKKNLPYKFELILHGSKDGFSRSVFEDKCFNINHTVSIMKIKETGEIVGGYNPTCWNLKEKSSDDIYDIETDKSFIFKISQSQIDNSILSRVKKPEYAMYHNSQDFTNTIDGIQLCGFFTNFVDLATCNGIDDNKPYCYYKYYNYYKNNLDLTYNSKKLHLLEEYEVYRLT